MENHLKILELDKVLEMLAAQTCCADAAEAARALTPAVTVEGATRLMDETDAAVMLSARFGSPSFGQLPNVTNALRRAAAGASLSLAELLRIGELLRILRGLSEWYAHCAGIETVLDDRFSVLQPNKYLEEKITSTVVSDEEVADNASPQLSDIRRKMRSAIARTRESLEKIIRSPAYQKVLQDPIVTIRDGRFVVPVKAEHRGELPGLVHDTSASGATVFVEPLGAVEANNELRLLEQREKAEIERIIAALSAEVGNFADGIIEDHTLAVELDLIFAKARLAYQMKAFRPTLTDDGHLVLCRARHPLLDPAKAVPVSLELGGEFDTLVITGPNTGGKTVTLKTIGLLTVMAMCGLMPPAAEGTRIPVFTRILADIGDEQSIEQSLSTFSAHMTNLIDILAQADEHSLVLVDELGAGTDPVEGAALAMAILERLRLQGARVAATTHYAELKAYALNVPGVENGSCEFDVATLRPTYRLLIGVPGRSNAFAISRRLGMDDRIVERAQALVSGDQRRLEEVVVNLDQRRQELERELTEARRQRELAARELAEAQAALDKAAAEAQQTGEKATADARRLVEYAKIQAEQLLAEIEALRREQKNNANTAKARDALRSHMQSLDKKLDPVHERRAAHYVLPRELEVGDQVELIDIDKPATVLALPDKDGNVQVRAGIFTMATPLSNLRLSNRADVRRHNAQKNVVSRATRAVRTELDVRGQAADEALIEVDRFLDEALLSGLQQVTVIHGKGTGVLRTAIAQHLRGHAAVRSFRPGKYGEGEMGVTVIELK